MSLFSLIFFSFGKCKVLKQFILPVLRNTYTLYEIKIANETQPSSPTWITITSRNHFSRRKYILNKNLADFYHLFTRDRYNWSENMSIPGKCVTGIV